MIDFLTGLLMGVLQFYAWTVGVGLVVLALISLVEGAVDFIRDVRPVRLSRPMPRSRA